MARRRRPNHFIPQQRELTASEFNADRSNRQQDHNQAAVDYYAKMRQAQLTEQEVADSVATKRFYDKQDYAALGNALGVSTAPVKDVWDEASQRYVKQAQPLSHDALKGRFMSLPSIDQSEIYMAGGARHLDPESGAKLLTGLQKTREDALNSRINDMGAQIAKGEIVNDPADGLFYRTVSESDGLGGTKKVKVKISPLEAKYIFQGREQGMIPDWSGLKDAAPIAVAPDTSAANVALSVGAKRDPFVTMHDSIASGEIVRDVDDFMGNVGIALTDSVTGISNGYTRGRNAIARLMGGAGADQRAMIPKLSAQRPDDPMWVASQAEIERERRAASMNYREFEPMPLY